MLGNIFDLLFSKESHYGELVREFGFILYSFAVCNRTVNV
jgi:hypothetical protein